MFSFCFVVEITILFIQLLLFLFDTIHKVETRLEVTKDDKIMYVICKLPRPILPFHLAACFPDTIQSRNQITEI